MFIITCIGDYFPLGVALNEKKDHESDNFEIDLIDKYQCHFLAMERDVKVRLEQDSKNGKKM